MGTFIFYDDFPNKGSECVMATLVKASSLDSAWTTFSHKWAIGNFGLRRDSTNEDVKKHFGEWLKVIEPKNVLELE